MSHFKKANIRLKKSIEAIKKEKEISKFLDEIAGDEEKLMKLPLDKLLRIKDYYVKKLKL